MNIPEIKIVPQITESKVSAKGFINKEDIQRLVRNALIFLTPTIVLYATQLGGALSDHISLTLKDITPSAYVIGAFEGYVISTFLDYLKKLNNAK